MFSLLLVLAGIAAAPDDNAALQGVWNAKSMESDGRPEPAGSVKQMRFTFKGDKLLIRGNFQNDREEECSYKIDASKSPKHLDFTPPTEKKPILAIYEIKGDELKMCIRHGNSSGGRPKEFSSKPGSNFILLVFVKAKPEPKK